MSRPDGFTEETADRMGFGRNRGGGAPYPIYDEGDPGSPASQGVSIGEAWVRSEAHRVWLARFPEGVPGGGARAQSDELRLRVGLSELGRMRAALVSADDASAGSLVPAQHAGLMAPGVVRPLTLRQLVTIIPTTSDQIEWVREVSRVSTAAPVPEAAQLPHTGDEGATKPEGGLTFALDTVPIRTIALWIPATKRIVSDAPALRAYIDEYLGAEIEVELEDQIVAGTGGDGFTGILNTTGLQTAGPPGAGENLLDVIRKGKRQVRTGARTNATAVLVNPEDAERIDLLKATTNEYIGSSPLGYAQPGTVWGLPLVETEAVPQGTALVGDFRQAVLFDRERLSISIGTAGDDFIRNIVRVLAELRAGFTVTRPAAFVVVSLG